MNFHIGRLTFRRLPAHSFAHEDCFTTIPNAAKTASKMFSHVHLPHFFTKFVVAVISFTANFHSMSFFFCYGEFTVFESFLCLTIFSILKTLTKASST